MIWITREHSRVDRVGRRARGLGIGVKALALALVLVACDAQEASPPSASATTAPPTAFGVLVCPPPPLPIYLPWGPVTEPQDSGVGPLTRPARTYVFEVPGGPRLEITRRPRYQGPPEERDVVAGHRVVHITRIDAQELVTARWTESEPPCDSFEARLTDRSTAQAREQSLLNLVSSLPPATATGVERPGPAPDAKLGFVVDNGGWGFAIRSETDPTFVVEARTQGQLAVSPDMTRIAYWKTGEPDWLLRDNDPLPHELRVVDLTTRAELTLLTLRAERAGAVGWIAWASDGTALAIAVHGQDSPETFYSAIRVVDLASGSVRELARMRSVWLRPIAWDRAKGLVGVVDARTGEGSRFASTYYVLNERGGVLKAQPFAAPVEVGRAPASPDGRWIAAIEERRCGNASLVCRTALVWTIEDLAGARRITPAHGESAAAVAFHPTSDALALVTFTYDQVRLRPGGRVAINPFWLEVWSEGGRGLERSFVLTGGFAFFRADGSAAVIAYETANMPALLLDQTSGGTTRVALSQMPFASVRLAR